MRNQEPLYRSYLLRLWTSVHNGEVIWRASLEDANTGERLGFATLERMFDFLRTQVAVSSERSDQPDPPICPSEPFITS